MLQLCATHGHSTAIFAGPVLNWWTPWLVFSSLCSKHNSLSLCAICLPMSLQEHLEQVRSEVLTAERAVLYTVCFQLRIQTPYATVLALVKPIKDGPDQTNVIQIAWSLVNDRCALHWTITITCQSCKTGACM